MATELKVVMFTDQVKSTSNTVQRTPAEIKQVSDAQDKLTSEVLRQHQGEILKDTGDGHLIEFLSCRDAVLSGFVLQQRVGEHNIAQTNPLLRFELHIGIEFGELVILENRDLRGNAANLAARVCSQCPPGEVYFTEKVSKELHHREAEVEKVGDVELKGWPEKVSVYRLAKWLGKNESLSQPSHTWEVADRVNQLLHEYQSKIVVGREGAFTRIDRLITEKPCGTLMITAKAGFGKTALLADWMKRRQNSACFIAYHFFNQRHEVTLSLISAYRSLLRQLFVYYGLPEKALPGDEAQLREMLYDLLSGGGHTYKPLVFLLDGIDEAPSPFSPPFPVPTPTGMFVIFSARADESEEPEYLRLWTPNAERLHLDGLSLLAIADWLRESGCAELAPLAEDENFVRKIEETTEGFPLYLSFLIEEIAQAAKAGGDIRALLEHSPQGFSSYVREQLRLIAQIEEVKSNRQVQDLFGFLSVAKGQLLQNDVEQLTGLSVWELQTLPWRVRRWMTVHTVRSLCLYALAHPLLAREFQHALGREAQKAKDKLLEYCSRWREHASPYALRFYDEHLRDGSQYERLFDLARDEDFRQAQVEAFHADPGMALKTVQTGLMAAADTDKAGAMTEFLLTHAQIAFKLTYQETPLDAWREGDYIKALKLADNYRDPLPVLWKLLLAWLLNRNRKPAEAKRILGTLKTTMLPVLRQSGPGNVATILLSHLGDLDDVDFLEIAQKLLPPWQLGKLAAFIAGKHRDQSFQLAFRLASFIINEDYKGHTLGKIALELANAARWKEALSTTDSIDDVWQRAWALCDLSRIALDQHNTKKVEELISAIQQIQIGTKADLRWQITQSLARLGVYFHVSGKQEESLKMLQQARDVATTRIGRFFFKGHAIADLAKAYAQIGQSKHADWAFKEAIYIAGSIDVPREAAKVFSYIALTRSATGIDEKVLETLERAALLARKIPDLRPRSEVLQEIAIAYTHLGKLDAATKVAKEIGSPPFITRALAEVTKVLTGKGDVQQAYDLAKNITGWKKAWILSELGIGLLNRGLVGDAVDTWCRAFTYQAPYGTSQLVSALSGLARGYLDLGDRQRAEEIISMAASAGTKQRTRVRTWHLINMAESISKPGDSEIGTKLLQKAYDEAKSEKKHIQAWLFAEIAEAASKLGISDFGKQLFKEAESAAGEIIDSSQKVRALGEIGEKLASSGNIDQAKVILETAHKIVDTIELQRVRAQSLASLALAYAKAGFMEKAKSLAMMEEVSAHADARRAQTLLFLFEGSTERAIEEAYQINDPKIQARALSDIAISECKKGRTMVALQIAQTIKSTKDIELHRIAKVTVENGDQSSFKRLLIPNAYFLGSAYILVGLLAQLYPAQARDIEQILLETEQPDLSISNDEIKESDS